MIGNSFSNNIEILLVEDNPGDIRLTKKIYNGSNEIGMLLGFGSQLAYRIKRPSSLYCFKFVKGKR